MRIDKPTIDIIETSSGSLSLGGNDITTSGQYISTTSSGTSPLVIASPTLVSNLNSDLLDGKQASEFELTLTKGNMTATSPIAVDQTRQVIGGAVVLSHVSTAGNIHLPTGGSSNQLLKNSGASGTGAWGTVTENAGALGAVTTLNGYNATNLGIKNVIIQAVEGTTDLALSSTGIAYFTIPLEMNGMVLNSVHARVVTSGSAGSANLFNFKKNGTNMLSTSLMVDSGELGSDTALIPYVISGGVSTIATNDLIAVTVEQLNTTPPKGLVTRLNFI